MPAARASRGKSSSRSRPLRRRWASIRASLVSSRWTSGFLAHLEREQGDRDVVLDRRMLGESETERGLTHGGTGGHDHEVGRLEARCDLIEIAEATRHAGDALAALGQRLDALHGRPEEFLDPREVDAAADLPELHDPVLRLVEQIRGRDVSLERFGHDAGGDLNEAPEERLLANDASVVLDVGGRRDCIDQKRDVIAAAARLELSAPRQLVGERQGIDHVAPFGEGQHAPEQPPVRFAMEHRIVDDLGRAHHGVRIDHHRRENGLLGILRIRGAAVAVRVAFRRRAVVRVRARCH